MVVVAASPALRIVFVMAIAFAAMVAPRSARAQNDIAKAFPDTARLRRDYPNDAELYVALRVLHNDIQLVADYPFTPAVTKRMGEYETGWKILMGKHFRDGSSSSFESQAYELGQEPSFEDDLLKRYGLLGMPALRDDPPGTQPAAGGGNAADFTDGRWAFIPEYARWKQIAIVTLVLGPIAVILLAAFLGRGAGSAPTSGQPSAGPFSLPAELGSVDLAGKRFPVQRGSGLVMQKQTGQQVEVETFTTGTGINQSTSTSVTSIQKDDVLVMTPDGHQADWSFTGGHFQAYPGQLVSMLWGNGQCLASYNHMTGTMHEWKYPLAKACQIPRVMAWAITTAAAGYAYSRAAAVLAAMGGRHADSMKLTAASMWETGLILSAILALLAVAIIGGITRSMRASKFRTQYLPKYQALLHQQTPAMVQHFADLEPTVGPAR